VRPFFLGFLSSPLAPFIGSWKKRTMAGGKKVLARSPSNRYWICPTDRLKREASREDVPPTIVEMICRQLSPPPSVAPRPCRVIVRGSEDRGSCELGIRRARCSAEVKKVTVRNLGAEACDKFFLAGTRDPREGKSRAAVCRGRSVHPLESSAPVAPATTAHNERRINVREITRD